MITHITGPLSCHRRPTIDVGNGEGFIEVYEVTKEQPGNPDGDFIDVAYCFNEQDAQLFAAAPDLLEAVDQVLRASEDNGDMDDIDWNLLRAAVAKAGGAAERVDLSEEVDPCPMCWCSDCCSYHADPKDEQHHKELQCSRPWPEWEKIMKEESNEV